MIVAVASVDDPRLDTYRAVRERDLVGRDGRFMLEGEVVLRHAAMHGRFPIESLLVTERRAAALADVLDRLGPVPAYVAPQAVVDRIAGFPLHRGVLAVGLRLPDPPLDTLLDALPASATVLVAIGIANHDNLGGLFRNAAAFGVDLVLVDGASCDPLYRKAIRVSVGTALSVPFHRGGEAGALCDALARRGFDLLATTPRGGLPPRELTPADRAAVLVGAEGGGLPAELIARCRAVTIPMAEGVDSLNVATAAAIVLSRLFDRTGPRP